jgi:integrase
MTLHSLLVDRYALLQGISDRSVLVYMITLVWFGRYLCTLPGRPQGQPTLDDLTDIAVAGFLRWRAQQLHRGRRVSAATVAKDRTQLLALWGFAAKKRMKTTDGREIEFPSLPRSKVVRRIPVAYTVAEIREVIRIARGRKGMTGPVPSSWWWSTLLGTAFVTGERCGALLQLRWGQVDLERRRIVFLGETRKGGRADLARRISPELARELAEHRGPDDSLVWPWPGKPLSIYASLKLLCRRAGVQARGFHGIRRASASYVAAGGGDASAHLGHSSPEITQRHYLDPRITGDQDGIDYLPSLGSDDEAEFIPDPEDAS